MIEYHPTRMIVDELPECEYCRIRETFLGKEVPGYESREKATEARFRIIDKDGNIHDACVIDWLWNSAHPGCFGDGLDKAIITLDESKGMR